MQCASIHVDECREHGSGAGAERMTGHPEFVAGIFGHSVERHLQHGSTVVVERMWSLRMRSTRTHFAARTTQHAVVHEAVGKGRHFRIDVGCDVFDMHSATNRQHDRLVDVIDDDYVARIKLARMKLCVDHIARIDVAIASNQLRVGMRRFAPDASFDELDCFLQISTASKKNRCSALTMSISEDVFGSNDQPYVAAAKRITRMSFCNNILSVMQSSRNGSGREQCFPYC